MSLRDEIEAQKAKLEASEPIPVTVVLNGKKRVVSITRLYPPDWANLAAKHPPRSGSVDDGIGYNQETLPADYPAEKIQLDGEPIDEADWRDLYPVLEPVHRVNIGNVIWGVNVYQGIKELQAGKSGAGKRSSSPASKASRRGAGSGGSPPK